MSFIDQIKSWFGGHDTAASDDTGQDTAAPTEPQGVTSEDVAAKAAETEAAGSAGETNPTGAVPGAS